MAEISTSESFVTPNHVWEKCAGRGDPADSLRKLKLAKIPTDAAKSAIPADAPPFPRRVPLPIYSPHAQRVEAKGR
jgi:hypothetical protein